MKWSIVIVCSLFILTSCGKKDESNPVTPPAGAPGMAVLVFPAQNEVCTQGVVISATQSSIPLKWVAAKLAGSYEVTIKNLEKGTITTQTTSATQLDVTLERNAPFSWYVTSKTSASTITAKSEVWKFYNPGPGTLSYAPFPAEAVNPSIGAGITAVGGKITLSWTGADADNDINGYDVYFGTISTNMAIIKSGAGEMVLNGVEVTSGNTYFWKVITKDAKGNTSASGMFNFKVN
jgi:hypothetical protein